MTEQVQYSHSRVSSHVKCPRQFQYRYIDGISPVYGPDADNDGIVGNALHTGAEHGSHQMLEWYYNQFPIIDDNHVNESIKLLILLPKLQAFLDSLEGEFIHEYLIDQPDFKGFVDLIVKRSDGTVDIYDFKYSNNISDYLKSEQLHLYKRHLEREGFKVNQLAFIFIPKYRTMGKYAKIRPKNGESLLEFRKRIAAAVEPLKIDIRYLDYEPAKTESFDQSIKKIESATTYPKNPTFLCDWCDYKNYCLEGDDTLVLPSSQRREIGTVKRKTLWIYGAPFSGKTWFANSFPAPLMLNTDGNIDFVDAPYIGIKDKIEVTGRLTNRTLAWTIFKDTITELEKKQNDFQTIIVDLLEDTYEHCRIYMYDKLGIEHESDNSFKAWDMVRTEFLSTIKRLLNLPYDIILISHEDVTKDITKRTGDKVTRIAPNIQEKAALKVSGMVQLVARVVSDDDDRQLTFKTSEVEFGGGRLGIKARKIPLEYSEFVSLYDEVQSPSKPAEEKPKRGRQGKKQDETVEQLEQPEQTEKEEVEERAAETVEETPARSRRGRRSEPEQQASTDDTPPWEATGQTETTEQPKRTRRTRRGQ